MTQPIDFYRDADKRLFKQIAEAATLPAFVVAHRAMSDDDLKKLGKGEFADPDTRTFPISSKADTWTSIAYFNHQFPDTPVLKSAAMSLESYEAREIIRARLAKAASLWGLEDEEVEQLAKQVTLRVPKKAESDNSFNFLGTTVHIGDAETGKSVVGQFIASAPKMSEELRRVTAGNLMKAASAVGTEVPEEQLRTLLQHAGQATCTSEDAVTVLNGIIPHVPHIAESRDVLCNIREQLRSLGKDTVLPTSTANHLVSTLEEQVRKYNIKHAAVADSIRRITAVDVENEQAAVADQIQLAGGIVAHKSSIENNADTIGNLMHDLYKVEAYGADAIVAELKKLSPREILPLRSHIGA